MMKRRMAAWAVGGFLFLIFTPATAETKLPKRDEALYQRTKTTLQSQGDFIRKKASRKGNQTIELEIFASFEGDFKTASEVMSRFDLYSSWILNGINKALDGHSFFMQIMNLTTEGKNPTTMDIFFQLNFPLFHYEGERKYLFDFEAGEKYFAVSAKTLDSNNSIVKTSKGTMTVYPAESEPNRLWLAFLGDVVIGPWMLYEALPEKLVMNESVERIQKILSNYQKEEDRIHAERKGKENLAAPKKSEEK